MVDLSALNKSDPTLEAIDAILVDELNSAPVRGHLGMSQIGGPCDASLWYQFRFATTDKIDARGARNIEDGHRGEELMAVRLRKVPGVKLVTHDAATGQQIRFHDHGGHFGGSVDGVIIGLLQAPRTYHIWENKESEKFSEFEKLRYADEKSALEKWNMTYFVQGQLYMHYAELERHYTTVSKPGGRATTSARTEYQPKVAQHYRERARRVIESPTPLDRVSMSPSWYECRYCPARTVCHGEELPAPSCRTCMHATPEMGGSARWSCAIKKRDLTLDEQVAGCRDHVYIPDLMTNAGFELVDADPLSNHVIYKVGAYHLGNGTPATEKSEAREHYVLPSTSWHHLPPALAQNEDVLGLVMRGAVPIAHELNVEMPPLDDRQPPPDEVATPKEVMKLLSRKQIDRMLATKGAVGKVRAVKGGKKVACVEDASGRLIG